MRCFEIACEFAGRSLTEADGVNSSVAIFRTRMPVATPPKQTESPETITALTTRTLRTPSNIGYLVFDFESLTVLVYDYRDARVMSDRRETNGTAVSRSGHGQRVLAAVG
jgi:hypothetical protein